MLSEEEYLETSEQVRLIAHLLYALDRERLNATIRMAEHSETVTPYLDPTLWMRKGEALRQEIAVMRALSEAKAKIHAVAEAGAR